MKLYLSVIKRVKGLITRLASFEETSKTLEGSEKLGIHFMNRKAYQNFGIR